MFGIHISSTPYLPFRSVIEAVGTPVRIEAGKDLLPMLAEQRLCIYVDSGLLTYEVIKNNGSNQLVQAFGRGSVFPVWKLERKLEPYAHVMAHRNCVTGYLLPQQVLHSLEEENDGMASAREQELSELMAHFSAVPLLYQDGNGLARVANVICLMDMARARGQSGAQPMSMTQGDIAQLTGMTRTQVTRILSELRKADIISTHGSRITVRDWSRLLQQTTEIAKDLSAM